MGRRYQSGNTGIGLAMVCAAKGYPLVVTMAETFSIERRRLMRFLGAKVGVTPAADRAVGMVNKTIELAKTHGWFMTRQFENEANPDYHSRTTAPEILDDFAGDRLDYCVTGYGTAERLRVSRGCSPKSGRKARLSFANPKTRNCSAAASSRSGTPTARPRRLIRLSSRIRCRDGRPDFIPKITEDAVAMKLIDRILSIPGGP